MEEVAIDSHDVAAQERLFFGAEELHLFAARVTKQHLGEMNVLTAKHYGNLGRLYQSMKRFHDAEEMHLKAISIKTTILGRNDYEVAISLGHLASLYNYDMFMFKRAEALHLQSIEIGIAQFGKAFSGLEFEYRGLLRVYTHFGDSDKVAKLYSDLHDWKTLRDQTIDKESKTSPLKFHIPTIQPEEMFSVFSAVCDS